MEIADLLNTVINDNCLNVLRQLPDKSIDLVLTDPPYPDYHSELYSYHDGIIDFLKELPCRQLIFWSAKVPFPLDYTAIHIWDKKSGAGSQYERIFERNGQKNYNVYRYYLINSTVAASFTRDVWTEHPSQKPIQLIRKLVEEFSNPSDLILDPFAGSGTTGVAAKMENRNFILIEKEPKYCEIAKQRISSASIPLFVS